MINKLLLIVLFTISIIAISSCAALFGPETTFKQWRGEKLLKGEGGVVETTDGIEFWSSGEPNQTYKIIGVITQMQSEKRLNNKLLRDINQRPVIDLVKDNNGDGVIIVKKDRFVSGFNTIESMNNSDFRHSSVDYLIETEMIVFRYTED